MIDNYTCPLCNSKYTRRQEYSPSNWECGSVKEGDSIFITDLCKARRRIIELEQKLADAVTYIVDPTNNEYLSKKKQSEKEMQKVIFKTDDKDDPKMTEEDWEDLATRLYK